MSLEHANTFHEGLLRTHMPVLKARRADFLDNLLELGVANLHKLHTVHHAELRKQVGTGSSISIV